MKKTDTHAFVNQLLVCLLATICFGGSIGLGTVWMRHQISVTANENRLLAASIAEVERHCDETRALVAAEQDLPVLRARNEQWHLGLEKISDRQVVRMDEDPVARLAARRGAGLLLADRTRPLISFNIAMKN